MLAYRSITRFQLYPPSSRGRPTKTVSSTAEVPIKVNSTVVPEMNVRDRQALYLCPRCAMLHYLSMARQSGAGRKFEKKINQLRQCVRRQKGLLLVSLFQPPLMKSYQTTSVYSHTASASHDASAMRTERGARC